MMFSLSLSPIPSDNETEEIDQDATNVPDRHVTNVLVPEPTQCTGQRPSENGSLERLAPDDIGQLTLVIGTQPGEEEAEVIVFEPSTERATPESETPGDVASSLTATSSEKHVESNDLKCLPGVSHCDSPSQRASAKVDDSSAVKVNGTKAKLKPTANGYAAKLLKKTMNNSALPTLKKSTSQIPTPKPKRQPQLVRSASVGSADLTNDCLDSAHKTKGSGPRENRASFQRKAQFVSAQAQSKLEEEEKEDYLTPLQKKAVLVKDLEKELNNVKAILESRDWQLAEADKCKKAEIDFIVNEKDAEINDLRETVKALRSEVVDLEATCANHGTQCDEATREVTRLTALLKKKEQDTQEMYLLMYKKGQQSAVFDRQVQLEDVALKAPHAVCVRELLAKLEKTQGELTKWQSLQRRDVYSSVERPDSEAQATLRFLRDSMFHYLTDHGKDQAQHLKTMIAILGFTDVQINKIQKSINDKK